MVPLLGKSPSAPCTVNEVLPLPMLQLTALKDQSADSKGIVGAIVVATDITDVKEVEIALKNSFEERSRLLASETAAKEASRLKSEFVSNIRCASDFPLR
jgi:hypothetical protein